MLRNVFLLVFIFLLFYIIPAHSQPADSFTRAIDSSRQALQEANKAFEKWQDSQYKLDVQRSLNQNSQNLDRFLADMKERERKERRQLYIRLGAVAIVLVLVAIRLLRRKKKMA